MYGISLGKISLQSDFGLKIAIGPANRGKMIAVEGCCHGELDAIYSQIHELEMRNNYTVDALLICGDFEALRNHQDLECMSAPKKYKKMGDFHKYYTGEKIAPILTIVIGGNHEASNYMWELYYGGWLAPNIYFMGHAGSIRLNGIPIAGASGIFKANNFQLGAIYHIREYCVRKLSLLSSNRIFLSHDWPQYIEKYGDVQDLLTRKNSFRESAENGTLGSPPLMELLKTLKPQWWFSAHMHTHFTATVTHESVRVHPAAHDEIDADADAPPPLPRPSETKFLALDQCRPEAHFLEVIDMEIQPSDQPLPSTSGLPGPSPLLSYDPEWLAITRAFHSYLSLTRQQSNFPEEAEARALVAQAAKWVEENVKTNEQGEIPVADHQTFVMTAPGPGSQEPGAKVQQPPWYGNPQTDAFCRMLDIPNNFNPPQTVTPNSSSTDDHR
ncbi:hypothetical protein M413DRAFT_9238 [Hebeloma cylindrosporum]|uniref:Lariat debranching enzyme C-terminal domain-containing protein n=1 Tax=Hebeloma cylindrosporum TaxID=76867 RepID=A0A0C3CIH0_HEBCY|nr:hypothetical protein M413DRAFT_9238 [Hebeloma cylindrosporum h7]